MINRVPELEVGHSNEAFIIFAQFITASKRCSAYRFRFDKSVTYHHRPGSNFLHLDSNIVAVHDHQLCLVMARVVVNLRRLPTSNFQVDYYGRTQDALCDGLSEYDLHTGNCLVLILQGSW
jgi:hypothetical protein